MRPNFLVIGAQKSATTTLCDLLSQHPDVYISNPKEPHFFAKNEIYAKGWDRYEKLFSNAGKAKAIGEGSTGYTMHVVFPNAPSRISRDLPNAKLIYIVRHPIRRIESAWKQRRGDGMPVGKPGETIKRYPRMIDTSMYWKQLSFYRTHYPDTNIQLLFFEDLKDAAETLIRDCFWFLGVDPDVELYNPEVIKNPSNDKVVPAKSIVWLRQQFLFKSIARFLPRNFVDGFKTFGSRPLQGVPEWDPESLEWLCYQLSDDTQRILEYGGKPGDYWDLSLPERDR